MTDTLSPRELEILAHIARTGESREATAKALGISTQTVKNTLTNAFRKMGAKSIIDAYIKLGWLRVQPDDDWGRGI